MPASSGKLRLLHPKWLLLHAFTLAAGGTMLLLGRWQWHVAHAHHGDIRYYAYALQWWAFVGFACLMWYRIVTDSVRRRSAQPASDQPDEPAEPQRVSRYLAYQPPQPAADPDPDPERARFNAYLAQLDAADRAAAGPTETFDRKADQ
ncbi:MAG TPA: hypothetical protein VJ851_05510 [Jatrophihabitans sp.]|nr:hypothetical protein [Jatrophihabitans sp.]